MKKLRTVFFPIAILSAFCAFAQDDAPNQQVEPEHRAAWMEGGWGIRFVMPAMKSPRALANFDVQKMIDQLALLDTASWIQINITQGANGSVFTSPHAELAEHVSPKIVPARDLFGEMAEALNKQGLKVMVYFASEGPTMERRPENALPGVIDSWKAYVASQDMTPKQGVAEIIVKEYSTRYGTKISGWWFDHAKYGDLELLEKAARAGNPDTAVAFNVKASANLNTTPYSDYTAGHPTPVAVQKPSWQGNEASIEQIENNNYLEGSLGHFMPPMQANWNRGEPSFKTEQALDWTMRIIGAGGAVTWAVALADTKNWQAPLAAVQFEQLVEINEAVKKWRANKN